MARSGIVAGVAGFRFWLEGSTEAEIVAQIRNPKHGVMSALGERLGELVIKPLAVDFHTLGGGQWGYGGIGHRR